MLIYLTSYTKSLYLPCNRNSNCGVPGRWLSSLWYLSCCVGGRELHEFIGRCRLKLDMSVQQGGILYPGGAPGPWLGGLMAPSHRKILSGSVWAEGVSKHTLDEIQFAPLGNNGKPLFVGIYRGIIILEFLRWCRILFVHSSGGLVSLYPFNNKFVPHWLRNFLWDWKPCGCSMCRAKPGFLFGSKKRSTIVIS